MSSSFGNENNASNPPRVWGTNGVDNFLRTYQTASLSVGSAATATLATKASTLMAGGRTDLAMTFNWSGQTGQPSFLWGGNDGTNNYVYNPSNFSVNYATTSGTATYLSATQQTSAITGSQSSMSMSSDWITKGSFVARATGAGDANLAGMSFWNDAYAIKLGIRADGYFGLGGWSRSAWSWYSDVSGNMVAAGNVTAYSDPRLKENFERVKSPLDIINKLDGGTFNWKHGIAHIECKAGKRDYGILADQVEAVMPEIVTDSIEIEGNKYKTVAYEKLVPVLIEAIKELENRIKQLESK
jgi:hypothetical protein